ncbi:sickle tail protein-like [Cheilinus undulatus]|uniref:sickle tail protein-like n=1 Tax=Cheilinus undulatus TaxID=241271 RepID=UPI001BD352F7|nr:sickle tail protein-like [Cheilinus undulatus]
MLRIGERLMRAGSEGNLVQRVPPAQSQTSSAGLRQGSNGRTQAAALQDSTDYTGNNSGKDPGSSSSVMDSSKDPLLQKKNHSSSNLFCNPNSAPRSPSTLPRSSASSAAGTRDSQSDSLMKIKDVERKKEVLLDILKQKYPHHAAIIMGHQPGSTWSTDSVPSVGGLVLKEQDSAEMSDGDLPSPSAPFTRGCKSRASLPVGRSGGHTGERPLGVLYLQYGEETKQVRMPAEMSSQDSLHALFVTAFPHQLTMKILQSPNVAIYIKDTSRNFYYELDDIRNISPHSCLKVYHKDPAHIFNRHARPVKTEGRISKEILYGSHSPIHSRSSSGRSTLQSLQGSMSPPMVRSMPSSPSRRVYGGGSAGGVAGDLGCSTLPRERLSGAGLSRSLCTNSSSSILERRDVKPDEDADNTKSMALVLRGEGGSHYADSYSSSLQDGGGRLSVASSQCSAPPSLTSDLLDSGGAGIPGTLQQYRASVKPLMGYGETLDQQTRSLHRPKSRKYGDSHLPPLGTRTPPASPQRASEVRLTDGQIIGGVGLVSAERMSPMRRSLRRDSNGSVEIVNKGRGSSSSTSSVFFDSPLGTPDRLYQGHVTPSTPQSERMKAMEEQIASLAGLVHHALSMGADIPGVKDTISDSAGHKLLNSRHGVSLEHQKPAALIDSYKSPPLALQAPPPHDSELQQSLKLAKRNVGELRLQLNQLRQQQLLNQQSVNSMLQMAGQELLLLMCDRVNQSEEATFRRRAEMEEERILYLRTEEAILNQLSELEVYVDHLQKSSASSPGQLSITLRDVEEAAVNLRRVGEALAVLKSEFPELQVKLRSVLRLEVEAVRFLKEEPHKMDAMLRRVRSLTEALSSLRRCVSESNPPTKPAQEEAPLKEAEQGSLKSSPKPQPRSSVKPPPQAPAPSEVSLDGSASPITVRRMKNTAASGVQPHHHHPSPPLTPTHGRDSPTVAKTAHRQPPEGGTSKETSTMNQSTTRPGSSQSSSTKQQRSNSRGGRSEDRTSVQKQEGTPEAIAPTAPAPSQTPAASSSDPPSVPPSAPTTSERSSRPQVEKPRRSSVERELKQSPDRAGRSPPPPPPRRFNAASSSASTARPAEEELTRREPLGAQDEDDKDKKTPQPKPPRQPPEIKPKPVLSAPPSLTLAAASAQKDVEKKKNEKEDNQVIKELQVTTKICNENNLSSSNENWKKALKTPATAQVINQNPSDPQVAPHLGGSQSCPQKLKDSKAVSHSERSQKKEADELVQQVTSLKSQWEVEMSPNEASHSLQTVQIKTDIKTEVSLPAAPRDNPTIKKTEEEKTTNQNKARKTVTPPVPLQESNCEDVWLPREVPLPVASPDVQTDTKKDEVKTSTQQTAMPEELTATSPHKESVPKKSVSPVCSPTTAEKKVKFTTIVTLQKDTSQTSTEQKQEKAVRDAQAEKKSNLTVVLTLQKENPTDDSSGETSARHQQVETLSSHQDWAESTPVLKRYPPSPDLTHTDSCTEQQKQKETKQEPRDRSQYTEDGGSLSPDMCDDEGPPPPPPPTGKISLRFSKYRSRAMSKEEDPSKTSGSDLQMVAVDSSGEPIYLGYENQGFEERDDFDKKPIIVILNEPMDFQSACKRLSTIFESEEDLDRILSSENLVVEDEFQQEQRESIRRINISEINSSLGLKNITENGQTSLPQRPSAGNGTIPENQESKPDSPKKTETKKKFKFKFPKTKLAAISQAIRTGTTKAGKKTLEVVVYEEEEEIEPVMEAKKQTKMSKETSGTKQSSQDEIKDSSPVATKNLKSQSHVEEICKNAFDSMDSLEESIKLLEISVDSISAPSSPASTGSSPPQSPDSSLNSTNRAQFKDKVRRERERSPSKRPASQILKGPNPPQSKRAKAQPLPDTAKTTTKKQTSSSSAQRPHTKSRHSSSSSTEKTTKSQPANQKQPSQPHVVTIPR